MSFRAEWFNKFRQFGSTDYTVLITDIDGEVPQKRIDKSFEMPAEEITEVFLSSVADEEIAQMQVEWAAQSGN